LFWLFFFWLFSNFFLLKGKKEKWVDAVDRVSEKKRKKETGIQVAVAERKEGENPVLSVDS